MTDEAAPALTALISEESIRLNESATDKFDAIRQVGSALLDTGAIDASYIDAMIERENTVSTFVGEGVAIPHGTLAGKDAVKTDALVVLRFPKGVDWDGNEVFVCVGIAARGNGHIALLSQLATVLLDPDRAAALRAATTPEQVYALLEPEDEDE
ncbi:MAG: PTS sugar transporter subunit IIA [Actinomycetota bacterium]